MTDDKGSNRSNADERGLVSDPKQLHALDWSAQLKLFWGGHWGIFCRLILYLGKSFPLFLGFPCLIRVGWGGRLIQHHPEGNSWWTFIWQSWVDDLQTGPLLLQNVICLTQRCFSSWLLARLFPPVAEGQISVLFKIFIRSRSAAFLNVCK